MKKSIVAIAAITAVVFFACQRQVSSPGDSPDNVVTAETNAAEILADAKAKEVCFEGEVLPIFQSSCAKSGCHNATSHKEGLVLDSYNHIVRGEGIVPGNARASELYKVIVNGEMPPAGNPKLTREQTATIRKWINQGARNTTNCLTCDTSIYSYSGAVSVILGDHCVGCHTGVNGGGGVDLATYTGVRTVALNGRLVGAVTHAPGYSPMPQGAPMLSDCNITQIEKWVADNAPNN
ncbi:MAG: c-type cytochrome domain-containing protein [Panacibacter sp.]